jgi:integrase
MPLYKHPKSPFWWIKFTGADGARIRRSSGTQDQKAAQELHDRLVADTWRQKHVGAKAEYTFDQLAVAYLKSIQGDRYYDPKAQLAGYWVDQFTGKKLSEIRASMIKAALPIAVPGRSKKSKPILLTPATQNRYLASISKMMSVAVELEWIDNKPIVRPQREPRVNVRWIDQEQASALIASCAKDWLRNVVMFALATGCRAGEILSLDWSQVDLEKRHAYIKAEDAKSGRSRAIPLNDLAVSAMTGRERTGLVFKSSEGLQMLDVSHKAFQVACAKAGIENFRFHDLRHTWASWHAQNGTPLMVLKELGGWQEISMIQKYAHLGQSHLSQYASNTDFSDNGGMKLPHQVATPRLKIA